MLKLKLKFKWMNIFSMAFFTSLAILNAQDNPTEPQSLYIVQTINNGEISLADLANHNSQNKDVKDFAKEMIRDHKKSNDKIQDLIKKDSITLQKSDTSNNLEKTANEKKMELKVLSGKTFDKAYISSQITMHQQALNLLDTKLIPSATTKDVKDLLSDARKTVSAHLGHATTISTYLK
ncbi:MAG: hypothetical protein JWQ35_255 [Bacteriovoracaceae bacterium]|nr:hypothetical protein [Bacteriovoracaceae bacterium]